MVRVREGDRTHTARDNCSCNTLLRAWSSATCTESLLVSVCCTWVRGERGVVRGEWGEGSGEW